MRSKPPRLQKQPASLEEIQSFTQESLKTAFSHPAVAEFADKLKALNIPKEAASGYGVNIKHKLVNQIKWYQELKEIPTEELLHNICPHTASFLSFAKYYDKDITASLCLGIKLRKATTGELVPVHYSHIKFAPSFKFEPALLRFLMPQGIRLLPFDRNGISLETKGSATSLRTYFYYSSKTPAKKLQAEFALSDKELKLFDHVEYTEDEKGKSKYIVVYDHFNQDIRQSIASFICDRLSKTTLPVANACVDYIKQTYNNIPCFYGQYKNDPCFSIYWSQANQEARVL